MSDVEYLDADGAADYLAERHHIAVPAARIVRMLRSGELPAMCRRISGDRYWYVDPDDTGRILEGGGAGVLLAPDLKILRERDDLKLFDSSTRFEKRLYVTSEALEEWVKLEPPDSASEGPAKIAPGRVTRESAQDNAITDALRSLGHDPANPPPHSEKGKPGLRADVKAVVMPDGPNSLFTGETYRKAWGRMRGAQRKRHKQGR